jgi:hypothetical protein
VPQLALLGEFQSQTIFIKIYNLWLREILDTLASFRSRAWVGTCGGMVVKVSEKHFSCCRANVCGFSHRVHWLELLLLDDSTRSLSRDEFATLQMHVISIIWNQFAASRCWDAVVVFTCDSLQKFLLEMHVCMYF